MSLSLQQAQKLSMGELSGISALELMYVQAEAANYLRNAKELKDWAGSRYFCESLFWASQPKQAAKT
jgi:hypothetical protein